jgi:hypothetical protein
MAVTVYEYGPININAGFKLECKIDSETDIVLLQRLFVDLCCRCLDINDLLLGYDKENNPVETGIRYQIKEPITMIFDALDKRFLVFGTNANPEHLSLMSSKSSDRALRRELFWDINADRIPEILEKSPSWVIVRVFQYGELEEIAEIIKLYGREKVKEVLLTEKLQPMAKAMAFYFMDLDL